MNKLAFAVYDSKAQMFHAPFFVHAPGIALRSFSDIANDPNSMIGKHPADFHLSQIGEYDEAKGVMVPMLHISHGCANNFVVPKV